MRIVRGFGRFCYDFLIGDDPKIAVAVVVALALGAGLVVLTPVPAAIACPIIAVLLIAGFVISFVLDVRHTERP